MKELLVALDVDTVDAARRWRTRCAAPSAASRSAAACSPPRSGIRRRARRARRPGVPRSEIPRHPEHGRRRGRGRARLGVWMVNVHAAGGARDDARGAARPPTRRPRKIDDRAAAGHRGHGADQPRRRRRWRRSASPAPSPIRCERLALLAQTAGLDGVVASPQEIGLIREACDPRFEIVTPGIRGTGRCERRSEPHGISRRRAGRGRQLPRWSGRPIIAAADPRGAALEDLPSECTGRRDQGGQGLRDRDQGSARDTTRPAPEGRRTSRT